jgi:hypothetical protein
MEASGWLAMLIAMQDRLFDRLATDPEYDDEHDPYEEVRVAGARLAVEFEISPDRGTDMVLSFGSEAAAHKALVQRYLLGEVELRAKAA